MIRKYQVKIDDSILPKLYSFDELIEKGILDEPDENIKVRQFGEINWTTARNYPFSNFEESNTSTISSETETQTQINPPLHHTRYTGYYRPMIHSTVTHTWNWGAFCFSWLWGLFNDVYWPVIIIALNFIPYIGVVVSFGVCLFLGLKGNDLAWKYAERKGMAISTFTALQAKWNIAGIYFLVLIIFIFIFYLIIVFV